MANVSTTDEYIQHLPLWQKENLRLFRRRIHDVFPEIEEEIKWGVPVFLAGKTMVFAMSAFKKHTKFNFVHSGAMLDDNTELFNNGFDSKKSRSIDMREGDTIDNDALLDLIEQAKTYVTVS